MTEPAKDVEAVFLAALDQPTPEARAAYAESACAGDPELLSRVKDLLAAHDESRGPLDSPPPGLEVPPTTDHSAIEKPGTRIGPYKLLQVIAEGGMGVVYMAEQTQPVQRRVALKVIKPGMDSRQVIGRFEAERQALSLMDHPNIAKVLDAGTTDSGRPYFVMELVKGVPITKYCDEQHLAPRERLELFIPVCQAVQHAHQKGIIHRDIKPSNVMVALYDSQAVPKVIDFGVAKAVGQALTGKTVFTQYGQIVGTVEYMSPEQAQLNELDIDTRSDVYSLGVLLYELLAGDTPFDPKRLRSAAFDEMLRIIREEEPPRPSTKLSSSESLASVAANRRLEPRKLSALVRGELDWIAMKAMEKDRSRRYESASAMAADVERYLNDEPVRACPPSAVYRLGKFARRHKGSLVTGALVAAALVVGIIGTAWQAIVATRAQRQARQQYEAARQAEETARREAEHARTEKKRAENEAERANAEAQRAKTEVAIAQAVNDFINDDLLGKADPHDEPNRDLKVREVLDRAAATIEGRFADQPLVEAAIRSTIGKAYLSLGKPDEAARHLERAKQIRQKQLGEDHVGTLTSMNNLAGLYQEQGRYSEAEPLFRKALEVRRRVRGEEHPDTLISMNNLASLYQGQGRYADAEPLIRRALEIHRRIRGEEHPYTLASMGVLADLYQGQGRSTDAEPLFREVLEIERRVLGEEHPSTLSTMNSLGILYLIQKRFTEAEPLSRNAFEIRQRILGEQHPDTLASMNNLAGLYTAQGRYAEAETLLRKALVSEQRVLGDEHPSTLSSMNNLADVYLARRRYDEAEPLFRKALEIRQRVLGEEHPKTLVSMHNLSALCDNQGRYAEAESLVKKALEGYSRRFGEEYFGTLKCTHGLAAVYYHQGRYREAETLFEKTLETKRRVLGEEHTDTLRSVTTLAQLHLDQGRAGEAEAACSAAATILRRKAPGDELLRTLPLLGACHLELQKYVEAERVLRECLAIPETIQPDGWERFLAKSHLGESLQRQAQSLQATDPSAAAAKFAEAEPLLLSGYEGLVSHQATTPHAMRQKHTPQALKRIVALYETWGQEEKANEWKKKDSQ